VAGMLMKASPQRDRLTPDIYLGQGHKRHPLKDLERAFALVLEAAPIEKKMREADIDDAEAARDKGVISAAEFKQICEAEAAVQKGVAVDAFPADEVSPIAAQHKPKGASAKPRKPKSASAKPRKPARQQIDREAAE